MRYDKVDPWAGQITEGQIKTIEYEIGEQPEQFTEGLVDNIKNLSKLEASWIISRVKRNESKRAFAGSAFGSDYELGMTKNQFSTILSLIITVKQAGVKLPNHQKLANIFLGRLIDCLSRSQASKLIVYLLGFTDKTKSSEGLCQVA